MQGDFTLIKSPAPRAEQQEMPFAIVQGEALATPPKDLYIPPDALEVILDAFEGPLDLLLYLIKRQNLDILEIPVAKITEQYVHYIEMMSEMQWELAAEYLVMAAMLAEIKSRMLLPRSTDEEGDESDPRAELIRRLQEYERYKQAAEDLDALPQLGRDTFQIGVDVEDKQTKRPEPQLSLQELLLAFNEVLKRADMFTKHHIERESLSVRERMSQILQRVPADHFVEFSELFDITEGRQGVVVSFLAILELIKGALLEMIQNESFGQIHVKAR